MTQCKTEPLTEHCVNVDIGTDLLQLQLQGPVALWHHSWPGVQDHAKVWLC